MVGYLALGLALAVGLFLLARGFRANPSQAWQSLVAVLGAVAAAIGVFFFVTGRPAFSVIAILAALVLLILWLTARSAVPSKPRVSDVTTRLLRLRLDHATGTVSGDILDGPLVGRRIETLRVEDLFDLYRYCLKEDEESARLVEAYLDRTAPRWRERFASEAGATARAPMSSAEALTTLGLGPNATADEIRAAHRRLMQQHHPDRGGDAETAARINRARDILLGE